jgi:hypothetical protein
MHPTGAASIRARLHDYCVEVHQERLVAAPIFGVGRWPDVATLTVRPTHLACSRRMSGRGNAQLCVLATAVAESTDDSVLVVTVGRHTVGFHVLCSDGEEGDRCVVITVDANGTWRPPRYLRCRRAAQYSHNRQDIVDDFDDDAMVQFGELHMTLQRTDTVQEGKG